MSRFALALLLACVAPAQTLKITIINADGPDEGFNDPTPVEPVGENSGTTLGEQRLKAFEYAAKIWGENLESNQPVRIRANFDSLPCTATTATLGAAGAVSAFRDFPGAKFPNTWYPAALALKIADQAAPDDDPEIQARFNSDLGKRGCFQGSPFYLGLDTKTPENEVNLVAVLLHEFGHGLGFSTFSNGRTGNFFSNRPSVYDQFLFDTTANKTWAEMTAIERAASAINGRRLVWNGGAVMAGSSLLRSGVEEMRITAGPEALRTGYTVGSASFGPALESRGISGEVGLVVIPDGEQGAACNPLAGANADAVRDRIALIDRGICTFVEKVRNAQNAGARAVIIADNAPGFPPPGLGGTDVSIRIPAVRITQADGDRIKEYLRNRKPEDPAVEATLALNLALRAGADSQGRLLMYTPDPFEGGSSVSHFDESAFPNLLMEPNAADDLTHSLIPPFDLTKAFMTDIGW